MENYEQKYKEALKVIESLYNTVKYRSSSDALLTFKTLEKAFSELRESEDERIRNFLIKQANSVLDSITDDDEEVPAWKSALAWLEKQGELSICNTPSREVILSIWNLGNEWKELTNGCISTEYGTQLDYIQKHWQESEYYLKEKQGEQKSAWSEEDEKMKSLIISTLTSMGTLNLERYYHMNLDEVKNWLKSIKPQSHWKPSEEQLIALKNVIIGKRGPLYDLYFNLEKL